MSNQFYKSKGPFLVSDILKLIKVETYNLKQDIEVKDIKDLYSSSISDITFFHSKKYVEFAKSTKASFCITTESLKKVLPTTCAPLVVENVLLAVSKLTANFYPNSIDDKFDKTATEIKKTEFRNYVDHGINVLVGDNVSIGSNCSIGSNTVIRNTIIKDNVKVLDNCVMVNMVLGFFQIN